MKLLDYIRGFRKGKDAHRLEHEAMNDPFLGESLEGYDLVEGNHAERIERMQRKLADISKRKSKPKRIVAWSAAASLLLLASLGGYLLLQDKEPVLNQPIAQTSVGSSKDTVGSEFDDNAEHSPSPVPIIAEANKARQKDKAISTIEAVIEPAAVADKYFLDGYVQPSIQAEESLAMVMADMAAAPVDTVNIPVVAMAVTKSKQEKKVAETSSSVTIKPSALAGNYYVSGPKTVRGKVVDAHGEPIPFVSITAKGDTQRGTVTDELGRFAISNVESDKLVASFLGYDSKEVAVDTSRTILIALNESSQALSEVVVTGYSRQRYDSDEDIETTQTEPTVGFSEYKQYLRNELRRPADSACANAKGRVVVEFEVDSSGNPYSIRVKKSLCESADQEAMRLVREGSSWTKSSSSPVRVTVRF